MMALISLIIALLFAAIFLFGGRLAYRPGQRGHQRFLSFAAGLAVAYVFVHLMPALGEMREFTMHSPNDFYRVFPEYSVYLWAMVGFLVFYGLETMELTPRRGPENHAGDDVVANPWQPWVHIGGFALYAWMLTHIMVWKLHEPLALCLYGVAMGLDIFPIACNLSTHYQAVYNRRGAYVLALASVAGWASGLALDIPMPIMVDMVAFVAGGVVVNAAIAEIPKERQGHYWSFLTGAIVYTAVLLTLSHFEKIG